MSEMSTWGAVKAGDTVCDKTGRELKIVSVSREGDEVIVELSGLMVPIRKSSDAPVRLRSDAQGDAQGVPGVRVPPGDSDASGRDAQSEERDRWASFKDAFPGAKIVEAIDHRTGETAVAGMSVPKKMNDVQLRSHLWLLHGIRFTDREATRSEMEQAHKESHEGVRDGWDRGYGYVPHTHI